MLCCRVTDMRDKDVICIKDGSRLGCVYDVEIDTCSGRLVSIIIQGRPKCLGLLGHEEDTVIRWECIEVIGEDTILVSGEHTHKGNAASDLLNRIINS